MRLLIIDDERLVLEGIEAFLQAGLPDASLDKTADVESALRLASNVPYELALLDWHLCDSQGREEDTRALVRNLRSAGLTCPIVLVSGDDREDWPKLLLELGLSGFVPKSAPGSVLLDAIQVALRGGFYLPASSLNHHARSGYRRQAAARPAPPDPATRFPDLTERQVEVFRALTRGLSDKQIARELGVSEATAKTHVRAILQVVGVHRRGEAVHELNQPFGGNA